jgi:membrane protein YdbS with pleckstrin-like domain
VARDRIQHIDINSGPMDRRFGLVQVVIHTAGMIGSVAAIPGLTPSEAEFLRQQLLDTRDPDA